MWLDTETGKRHISPPSTEGGEIVTPIDDRAIPIEEISIEETTTENPQEEEAEQETAQIKSNDRKRNQRTSQDRSDTVESGSDAEAQHGNQEK